MTSLLEPTARPGVRKRVVRSAAALVAVAVVSALLLWAVVGDERAPAAALSGRPAPTLAGPTVQGGQADLADLRGSVVLVNVWSSWCGPCRDELPVLVATADRLRPAGLETIGLNMSDGHVAAQALLQEADAQSLISIEDPDGAMAVEWGVRGVPETFLVDRDGVVRERRMGEIDEQWVQDVVEPYLAMP